MKLKYASNERMRAIVLESYNIDSSSTPNPDFDQIVFLTATICKVPVAYLAIIEPETLCFKARYGIDVKKLDRKNTFIDNFLRSGKDFIAINYNDNPQLFERAGENFNKQYRFYAAVMLRDTQGYPLGTLNILDVKERRLEETQEKSFKALANQNMKLLEYGKKNYQFQEIQDRLRLKYKELEKFANLVSHDIKSPLANIISLTELLIEENQGKLDDESLQYLDYLVESSYSLRNYVDGILSFYRSDHILEKDYENVDLHKILQGIAKLYEVSEDVIFEYPEAVVLHHVNKAALTQVFLNVISNGLKYNRKPVRKIRIDFKEDKNFYYFVVTDNGEGFPETEAARIFELFTTLETADRHGNSGTGIGLATVKKLVDSMGGKIDVKSVPGEGTSFSFTIQRL